MQLEKTTHYGNYWISSTKVVTIHALNLLLPKPNLVALCVFTILCVHPHCVWFNEVCNKLISIWSKFNY